MNLKVSELDALVIDLIREIDGVKVINLQALKDKLQGMGVEVTILPDGPPDPGRR